MGSKQIHFVAKTCNPYLEILRINRVLNFNPISFLSNKNKQKILISLLLVSQMVHLLKTDHNSKIVTLLIIISSTGQSFMKYLVLVSTDAISRKTSRPFITFPNAE